MPTSAASVDSSTAEQELLSLVSSLAEEIGSHEAVPEVNLHSSLERDLGLGSLERVELLVRVESHFGRRLPDETAQTADSPAEWLKALSRADSSQVVETRYPIRQPAEDAPPAPAEARSFTEVLRRHADAVPERVQVHLLEEEWGQEISYSHLFHEASEVAAGLVASGLQRNDTVAIMLPTCTEFFYSFLGVMLAGGVAVPIYPPARPDKIEEYVRRQSLILQNAEVRFLISFDQVRAVSKVMGLSLPGRVEVTTAQTLQHHGRGARTPQVAAADAFFIQYTSGSTGDPKGVVLTHENVLANVRGIGWAVGARPDDAVVSWLPLYHDMGLIGSWLFSVYQGFPITVMSPLAFLSRPERWLWALSDSRGTLCPAPNFSYELCARKTRDEAIEGVDLSKWRVAINAGEPVLPDTLSRFAERFERYGFRPESYVPCYGLAESSVALTFPPLNRPPRIDVIEREHFKVDGRAVPTGPKAADVLRFVANGNVLPGHEVRIVDEEGQEVGERIQGRVLFRGPSKTNGYFRNPDATAAVIDKDGWMDSGDLGYLAGGEIFVTGRKKDCIIKAGHNIIPQEIEMAAADVADVRRGCVAAFGSLDPESGTERLVVVAETRSTNPIEHERIKADIVRLVDDAIGLPPDHVELVPPQAVPKTSSGKIRRLESRNLYESGKLGATAKPPWLQVARLWMENADTWVTHGLEAGASRAWAFVESAGRQKLAITGGLLARLAPSQAMASWVVRRAAGLLSQVDHAQATEGRGGLGGPVLFVSCRSGPEDALHLLSALPQPTLLLGERGLRSLPWATAFLLEPLLVLQSNSGSGNTSLRDDIRRSLEAGCSVLLLSDAPDDAGPWRSRFRLEPMEAAGEVGSPIVPVYIDKEATGFATNNADSREPQVVVKAGRPQTSREGHLSTNGKRGVTQIRDKLRRELARLAGQLSNGRESEQTSFHD